MIKTIKKRQNGNGNNGNGNNSNSGNARRDGRSEKGRGASNDSRRDSRSEHRQGEGRKANSGDRRRDSRFEHRQNNGGSQRDRQFELQARALVRGTEYPETCTCYRCQEVFKVDPEKLSQTKGSYWTHYYMRCPACEKLVGIPLVSAAENKKMS